MKMRKSTIMAIEAFGNTLYRRFAAKTALILTLAGVVCLAGAVLSPNHAEAINVLNNYGYENGAEPAGQWIRYTANGTATEGSFASSTGAAQEGTTSFYGYWTSGGNNRTGTGGIRQAYTVPAYAVKAVLRGYYRRNGQTGTPDSFSIIIRLTNNAMTTVVNAESVSNAANTPVNDGAFATSGWTANQSLTASATYYVAADWSTILDATDTAGAYVDNIQLNVSPYNLTSTGQTSSSVALSWSGATAGANGPARSGYNIYYATASGGPYTKHNGTPQAGTTYDVTGLSSGTTYYFVVTDVDANSVESPYSIELTQATTTAPINLTVGQGTDPSAAPTVCPGSGTWTDLDKFTLALASAGPRTVDSITVALGAGDGAGISQIRITNDTPTQQCINAAPSGDTIAITGCSISVDNAPVNTYRVQIMPKAQAGPAGASYAVNGTVSTVSGSGIGTVTDNDTASDTVTVDDLSPSNLAGSLTATGSDGQVSLSWTSTAVNVVLVNSTDSTVNTPVEGTAYVTGNFIGGTDKVIYAGTGTGTPKLDTPLSNGQQMWYKIFVVDACNNHSTPGLSATATPSVAAPCDDDVTTCTECHLMPPSDGTRDLFSNVVGSHDSASHVEGTANTDCVMCHGTAVTGLNHRNGNINMAAVLNSGSYSKGASFAQTRTPTLGKCSNTNCHGIASPTWGNTGGASCSSCHPAQTGTNPVLDGKHKMHFNTSTATTSSTYTNESTTGLYRINCAVCHDTAGQSKSHIDGTIQTTGYRVDVLFNATQWSTTWGGGYSGGTTTTATASGSGFIYYTGRQCNNLYCHSTVQANGGSGAPTYTTPTWATTAVLNCAGCHAATPATGQHVTHVTTMAYACTKCHNTGAGTAPTHVNGVIEMKLINGASAVYGQGSSAARNGYSGCTNVYCHGAFNGANGTINTPSWGNAAHGNCGTCHGATIAQTPSRINHPRHVGTGTGNLGSTGIRCADCHGSTAGAVGHENVRVSWNLNTATAGRLKRLAADANPTYRAATSGTTSNAAPSPSYGTCANIYCHSNAQVDGGGNGALTYGAPTWGATSVACAATACHNNTTLTTGAHERHVATGVINYVCNNCHNGGGDQTANHTNKLINFAFLGANAVKGTYSEGAATAPGNGTYGTCNNTACHGTASPVWSASRTQTAGNAVCTTCHGVWNTASPTDRQIAPGYTTGVDTGGSSSAADANVGAHSLHLGTGTMMNTAGFACSTCHTMPTTVGQAGHINSRQPAELIFNALANRSGAQSPAYAGATGTCNTTYCHANTRATWIANTTTQNPVWNNTGLLTGAGSDCTKCHNMTTGHNGADCSGCHDHVEPTGDISFLATQKWKHMDGTIQSAGGCPTCHPAQTGTNPVLDGKHKMHYNTSTDTTSSTYLNQSTTGLYRINCAVCHDTAGQGKSHSDVEGQVTGYRVDVLFNATQWSTTWGGGYSGGTTSTATASGSGFIYYTGRTCNNLYCHSTVQANGGSGAPTYTTPTWATTAVLNCAGCHAATPATGQHVTHVTTMAYACTKCHKTTAGAAPSHVNGIIDMQLINGASAVYGQGSSAARNGYSGCTNVYCHGAFNGANGTMNTPSWGNTSHGNCGTCHGASIAKTPSRINHPRHVGTGTGNLGSTGIRCADCHGSTAGAQGHENVRVSWNLNAATAGRLKRLAADANPTYRAATSGTTSNAAPSPSYGTCANIYCHSNAQAAGGGGGALTYGAPTWGATSVACAATACHGSTNTDLTTGSHPAHIAAAEGNYTCSNCHSGGGDQTANHTNKLINIAYLGANAVKGTYSEGATTAPGSGGYGRCSNTACHGADSPTWGVTNVSNDCTTCHGVWGQVSIADERVIAPGWSGTSLGVDTGGSSSAADMNVGAHAIHLGAGTMMNATGFECAECHRKPPLNNYKAANHIDSRQPAELVFNATSISTRSGAQSPAYVPTSGTCNTTYCHANTRATWVANTTTQNPVWNNTGLLTGAGSDCTKCHNMTSGHYGAGCSGCHDHVAANNISFIATRKWKHADGVIQQQGGDCLGCHGSQKASAAFPGKTRAQIVGGAETAEGGDFIRRSGHVSSDSGVTSSEIVTIFDCALCHMEGDTSANQAQHDGYVDLRNVDSASGGTAAVAWPGWRLTTPSVAITTAHRDGMDTFCINCHDLGGAAGIAVSGAGTAFVLNPGASSADALHPFNSSDTLANGRDTLATYRNTTYGRVLNVKDQFNSGNLTGKNWASHHNLNQWNKRYTTTTGGLNASVWAAYTTRESKTLNETVGLHCSDCHLNESNAHGSANSWYMLCGKSTASCADVAPTLGLAAAASEVSCFRCHNSATYATGSGTTNSRHDHKDCESRFGAGDMPFEIQCLGCHGGYSSNVDGAKARGGLGAIHGTNESYTPLYTGSVASKRYRFMSGAAMRFYDPNAAGAYSAEANWQTATSGGCYTVTAYDTWIVAASACAQHTDGTKLNASTDGGGTRNLAY